MSEIDDMSFEEVQKKLERAEKAHSRSWQRLSALKKLRDEMCPHTDLELKSDYYGGSYYDKATTTQWMQCKCCGAKGPETVETHSWYG